MASYLCKFPPRFYARFHVLGHGFYRRVAHGLPDRRDLQWHLRSLADHSNHCSAIAARTRLLSAVTVAFWSSKVFHGGIPPC